MGIRATQETLTLRHEFTDNEKLDMGMRLAQSHNLLAAIKEEEEVMKAQIKDRKAGVEQTIGMLYRSLNAGFQLDNVPCRLSFDDPNPFEVAYYRMDNGERVKVRAMTDTERQIDLPLEAPKDEAAVEVSVAASEAAVETFFEKTTGENLAAHYDHDEEEPEEEDEDEEPEEDDEDQSDAEYDPDLGAIAEPAEPDEEEPIPGAVVTKRGRGRPRKTPVGFDKPTNATAF